MVCVCVLTLGLAQALSALSAFPLEERSGLWQPRGFEWHRLRVMGTWQDADWQDPFFTARLIISTINIAFRLPRPISFVSPQFFVYSHFDYCLEGVQPGSPPGSHRVGNKYWCWNPCTQIGLTADILTFHVRKDTRVTNNTNEAAFNFYVSRNGLCSNSIISPLFWGRKVCVEVNSPL